MDERLRDIVLKLRQDPNALSWRERRDAIRAFATDEDESPDLLRDLLFLLADDPIWEVRREVAEQMSLLEDDDFARLAAKLSADENSYVFNAATRSLDRRRKGRRNVSRKRSDLELVAEELDGLQRIHGPKAAATAREIGERLHDLSVGACVHNLRGVFTPIRLSVTKLLDGVGDGSLNRDGVLDQIERVHEKLQFLERLLEDMRGYSQSVPQERHRERLTDVVGEAVSIVEANLESRGVDRSRTVLEVDVPSRITADVAWHQIVTAFVNVLKNAFDAVLAADETAGRVLVRCHANGDDVAVLIIEDNGVGMAPDDLRDIRQFVPGKTTKKQEGTGFGLPTAQRYLRAHGGTLAIESHEGRGTRVTITIPTGPPEPEQ